MYIEGVQGYVIPLFGNNHSQPYGSLIISDSGKRTTRRIKEDDDGTQYIVFQRKKFGVQNMGSLYNPKFEFVKEIP